jgi:predicted alpha/beta superfamily hydrolase
MDMKIKVRFALIIPIISFLLLANSAQSQNPNVRNDSLYSDILKEQRNVQVIFPKKYIPNATDKFDVLYVLDGEWNTSLVELLYQFLEYAKFIPTNMIIVSIPNLYRNEVNMRDRDFTPTQTKSGSISGGANNFLLFLKEELIPFVNKKYPTRIENNILYGTSLGGLFAIYSYLHEPALFKSYITVEPSLWWDNGYLNKIAPEKLRHIEGIKNTLWIASRDGDAYREMGVADFDSLLLKAPKDLSWKIQVYPNETHFSAIWKGVYEGVRFDYTQPTRESGEYTTSHEISKS